MQTLITMWQGFLAMPLWVKLWMAVMVVINGILPFYFIDQVVAQITVFAIFSSGILAFFIVKAVGFNKFLGLMHATWLPMVYLQIHTLVTTEVTGNFAIWLITSLIISLISLAFDIMDVVQYTKNSNPIKSNPKS